MGHPQVKDIAMLVGLLALAGPAQAGLSVGGSPVTDTAGMPLAGAVSVTEGLAADTVSAGEIQANELQASFVNVNAVLNAGILGASYGQLDVAVIGQLNAETAIATDSLTQHLQVTDAQGAGAKTSIQGGNLSASGDLVAGGMVSGTTVRAQSVQASALNVTAGRAVATVQTAAAGAEAQVGVLNAAGHLNGLQASATGLSLQGGTASTALTLDDRGAQFADTQGNPVRVTGVLNGSSATDAVNFGQLAATHTRMDSTDAAVASLGTRVDQNQATAQARMDQAQAQVAMLNTSLNQWSSNLSLQDARLGQRLDRLDRRVSAVENAAYRGVAIALAAQQPIPHLAPGRVAVYGGLGQYQGATGVSLGLATVMSDQRTAFSAALGMAGGDMGGRVGLSYVFGE